MKIAITADVHLTTYEETPERYHALEDILRQAISEKADVLLICGDLFNENFNNYVDFEELVKRYPKLNIWILPGNHDANISSRSVIGKNIRIFETAEIIDDTFQLLFLPYVRGKTMGEAIAEKADALTPGKWVLFGHGDYLEGVRTPNPFETGTYMALTRPDVVRYQPARVFLGHIHGRSDKPVCYPGSPCGVDITETGARRFLIYDTAGNTLIERKVETDVIYHECIFTILPVENEIETIKKMVSARKEVWAIPEADMPKTRIRVQVRGYTHNKSELFETLNEEFKDFSFYKNETPDLSKVNTTVDVNRIKIAESVKEKIDAMELNPSADEPDSDQVLMKSLALIFEG